MNKIKCETCKSKIKKVDKGTLYCAKTRPIRECIRRLGDSSPCWCPRRNK